MVEQKLQLDSPSLFARRKELEKEKESANRFEAVNRKEYDDLVTSEHAIWRQSNEQIVRKYNIPDKEFNNLRWEYWDRRNQTMANNICRIARSLPSGSRIAVDTGAEHRGLMAKLLENCTAVKTTLFYSSQ